MLINQHLKILSCNALDFDATVVANNQPQLLYYQHKSWSTSLANQNGQQIVNKKFLISLPAW